MKKRNRQKKYNASPKGVARQLRSNHGFGYHESYFIARKCVNDFQRCEICGIPQWWNRLVLGARSLFIRGDERVNRRLVPDHIEPGTNNELSNIRILCYACNDLRGAKVLSDEQVLDKVRSWYREKFSLRYLWWLNSSPGEGGTLFRNKWMQRKVIKMLGPEAIEELKSLQLNIDDTVSNSGAGPGSIERSDNAR